MRSNWPIAFSLAACAHAGVVASLSGPGASTEQEASVPTVPLELRICFVDSRAEPAPPTTRSASPPEPVALAAGHGAMPPAEFAPAATARSRVAGAIAALGDLDVRRGVESLVARVSLGREMLRIDARTVAGRSAAFAKDALGRLPALAGNSRAPVRLLTSGSPSGSIPGTGPTANPEPPAAGGQDAPAGSTFVRAPVPAGGNRPPAYPAGAMRMRVEGVATIVARINALGSVVEARIERTSGASVLDDAALEAVRRWRFVPAMDSRGESVECEARLPIEFRIRSR